MGSVVAFPVERIQVEEIGRDDAIARIRAALKQRSGKTWSVRGGRGTGWGWIDISAPPKRLDRFGAMSPEDCELLGDLLDMGVAPYGVQIPASTAYRVEYVDRAEGRPPRRTGTPYWD